MLRELTEALEVITADRPLVVWLEDLHWCDPSTLDWLSVVARRRTLHRRIGERKEQAYGDHAHEIAVELAVHFEQGRDYRKAIQYLQRAGQNATQHAAYMEAIALSPRVWSYSRRCRIRTSAYRKNSRCSSL